MKKKLMSIVLSILITITGIMCFPATDAKAEDYDIATNYQDALLLENDYTYTLTIGGKDFCWYKYIMPGRGHVNFSVQSSDGKARFYLNVYDENLKEIQKTNSTTSFTTSEFAYPMATTIYLKVSGPSYNTKYNSDYIINTNYTESNEINGEWETEGDNDTIVGADELKDETPLHGVIITNSDTDYYEYSRSDGKEGKVSFTLTNLSSKPNARWDLTVVDGSGKKIKQFYNQTGDLSIVTPEYDLGSYETIYVVVQHHYMFTGVGLEYEIQANFTETKKEVTPPEAPSLAVTSKGKNNLKIKYNKPENTTKFEFQYRKNGTSSWKTKTTTKTNINLKGLKRKTSYQIRVRAIRTEDGKDYVGEWSSVKTAKTK